MSFDDLPSLPPFANPAAQAYADRVGATSRAAQSRTRTALDLRYGEDYWQKIDLYLPADAAARNLPVFCFMHGGAWVNGTKEWMGFMAPPLVDLPAIFVSVNYRLAPNARFPAQMADCFDAVAWVYRNIARYGGDPNRIVIGGHSAGGHLAALVTLRRDHSTARGLPPDVIKACLPVSGAFDLRCTNPPAGSMEELIYTALLARREDDAGASPISYVAGNDTPFFIVWGSRDFPSLMVQGQAMVAALKRQAGPVVAEEFAGLDHFQMNEEAGRPESQWTLRVRRWLNSSYD